MISILVLTKNESRNIGRCLHSLSFSDDVVVLDSFSTDDTVAIAESLGARVYQRNFDDWSSHQNYAVSNLKFKHQWVYYSDADEVVTPELRDEILAVIKRETETPLHSAYRVRYKNMLFGRWIRHCSTYPVWVTRLFRPQHITWQRLVNPIPIVQGSTGHLQQHFVHHSFENGMAAWFDKHNRYSSQEALEALALPPLSWRNATDLFTTSVKRRQALKRISFALPFRPELHFIYRYVLRLGFLDGYAGFLFCRMMACYETMIVAKEVEARHRARAR